MAKIEKFHELIAWQEAHKITVLIYKITENFPASEKFNLTSQLRRAAVSIESCIAEGFGRYHYKDRLNFYYDSRGSLNEVWSQMITAKDLHFVSVETFNSVMQQIEQAEAVLGGLIRSTRNLSGSS